MGSGPQGPQLGPIPYKKKVEYAIGINQCLYLPKAELNTKNLTKRRHLVEFLLLNSIYQLKHVPPDAEKAA